MATQTVRGLTLSRAREETDALFDLVRPDSLYERPIPERHRIIFYLGHLEAFDWNLIARCGLSVPSFHPEFDQLFAFGIDPPKGRLPEDRPSDWPSVDEVRRYNERTRNEIDKRLDLVPEQLLHVAAEHRLMHAETFAYMLHNLPYRDKVQREAEPFEASVPPALEMLHIPAGEAVLGMRHGDGFGWDNEFERHSVPVPEFRIGKYKVTNGDYLEFLRQTGAAAPHFWVEHGSRWYFRGMFQETPLLLNAPVYASRDEAAEYARWRGMRLPTEAEFHRALLAAAPEPSGNYNFRRWDPEPVTAEDGRAGANGPRQLAGNGWEWTDTPFAPHPGFEPFPFYRNYSEPFFDGLHYVLKGASPRTAACFLRPSFRNWFRASYEYAYTTFRLVSN